ncbi:membrane protein involved in the export of O-antigen and teichoic acid [Owenweeksia hongkongensis DSM 17368]|uniref:Membrane protein involved in the export of O-antigen and teichoic acid n=1 Tax=Owenweeksia hongkongensis (strain DSM 17368 / CIP 108786 / JCM 12287 / NRRL B-23963 / UST20020801) TaxID=926562 RepID=G8R514_OWEHD|nr:oligosaccharide flippase family protein [Owenweeksia hongkongensis]AEV34328.1 membrane protein involved in the export of O-antigen and teichoic acid [Owenweeksia hongkongensis DSM 17368]
MTSKLLNLLNSQKFYAFTGSVVGAAFSLLSFGLLARSLSKADFGLWTFFLTVFSFSELVMNGLAGRPLIKMGSEGDLKYQKELISSAFRICIRTSLGISIMVAITFLIIWFITNDLFYIQLLFWFTSCSMLSIPHLFAIWTNSMQIKFQRVTLVTGSMKFFFMIGVIIVYVFNLGLDWVYIFFFLSTLITSIISLIFGWSNLKGAIHYSKRYVGKIFNFGKFSVGTMLGSSALSSSDTFLIMAFLGPEAVAVYNVPMRIVNIYDIPLRSLVQIAYPTLSKIRNKLGSNGFLKEFYTSSGFAFLVLLPLSVSIFVFAELLVKIIGGDGYVEAAPLLRVFGLYLVMTPLDRFGGIALDVLNKPNLNFKKMMIMLFVNVVGDLLAIYLSGGVTYIAIASIFTLSMGTFMTYYYLRVDVPFKITLILLAGKEELLRLSRKLFLF